MKGTNNEWISVFNVMENLIYGIKCWIGFIGSLPVFSSFNDWPTFTKTSFRLSSFLLEEHNSGYRLFFVYDWARKGTTVLPSCRSLCFFQTVHATNIAHSPSTLLFIVKDVLARKIGGLEGAEKLIAFTLFFCRQFLSTPCFAHWVDAKAMYNCEYREETLFPSFLLKNSTCSTNNMIWLLDHMSRCWYITL